MGLIGPSARGPLGFLGADCSSYSPPEKFVMPASSGQNPPASNTSDWEVLWLTTTKNISKDQSGSMAVDHSSINSEVFQISKCPPPSFVLSFVFDVSLA